MFLYLCLLFVIISGWLTYCGASLKKKLSRHAQHAQATDYNHTNQAGKDKAAAAALSGVVVPTGMC